MVGCGADEGVGGAGCGEGGGGVGIGGGDGGGVGGGGGAVGVGAAYQYTLAGVRVRANGAALAVRASSQLRNEARGARLALRDAFNLREIMQQHAGLVLLCLLWLCWTRRCRTAAYLCHIRQTAALKEIFVLQRERERVSREDLEETPLVTHLRDKQLDNATLMLHILDSRFQCIVGCAYYGWAKYDGQILWLHAIHLAVVANAAQMPDQMLHCLVRMPRQRFDNFLEQHNSLHARLLVGLNEIDVETCRHQCIGQAAYEQLQEAANHIDILPSHIGGTTVEVKVLCVDQL